MSLVAAAHIENNVREGDKTGLLTVTFRHPLGYMRLDVACDRNPWLDIQCYVGDSTPGFTYHASMQ